MGWSIARWSRTSRRGRGDDTRRRRGAAAAEFALTLPVLIFLLLATIEYGNYFAQLAMVNAVTRDAARFGSNQPGSLLAQTASGNAVRTLLGDLGFDCDLASECVVNTNTYQDSGMTFVELRVRVPYDQLTHAIPTGWGMGIDNLALPRVMRARAVYPLVGP